MIERLILSHLVYNEEYGRKVLPFLKDEYFKDSTDKIVYEIVDNYIKKFNAFPTKEALVVEANNLTNVNEEQFKNMIGLIDTLSIDPSTNIDWLLDQTEKFCQDKAIYNAIMSSIKILDKKVADVGTGSIPKILSDALAVSFDAHIGHDFLQDYEERFDFYHTKEKRISFDLDYMNKITKGGLPNKTLNIVMAGCVHPDTKIRVRLKKSCK